MSLWKTLETLGPVAAIFAFLRLVRFLAIKAESQLEILKISK